jgi:hypothetical protein
VAQAENGTLPKGIHAAILGETDCIERDARVAVRCHSSAATFWNRVYYLLGLPTAVLAALSGISALSEQPLLAAGLAIGATIFAATNTFLNAGQLATAHAKKRSEYEQLKNEIRHFRSITLATQRSEREVVRELARHNKTRDVLNLESPQVSLRAHERALVALRLEDAKPQKPVEQAPPAALSIPAG